MPKYAIVVRDPVLARDREIGRNIHANLRAHPGMPRSVVEAHVTKMVGPVRPRGTVHDVCDSECPNGLTNCRNCGDPAFAESCLEQGHCPHCGTRHGIAPDSIIKANGYELVRQ